jgi:hypothetical protein
VSCIFFVLLCVALGLTHIETDTPIDKERTEPFECLVTEDSYGSLKTAGPFQKNVFFVVAENLYEMSSEHFKNE